MQRVLRSISSARFFSSSLAINRARNATSSLPSLRSREKKKAKEREEDGSSREAVGRRGGRASARAWPRPAAQARHQQAPRRRRCRGRRREQQRRREVPAVGIHADDPADARHAGVPGVGPQGERVEERVPPGEQPRHQEDRRRVLRQAAAQLPHRLRLAVQW